MWQSCTLSLNWVEGHCSVNVFYLIFQLFDVSIQKHHWLLNTDFVSYSNSLKIPLDFPSIQSYHLWRQFYFFSNFFIFYFSSSLNWLGPPWQGWKNCANGLVLFLNLEEKAFNKKYFTITTAIVLYILTSWRATKIYQILYISSIEIII